MSSTKQSTVSSPAGNSRSPAHSAKFWHRAFLASLLITAIRFILPRFNASTGSARGRLWHRKHSAVTLGQFSMSGNSKESPCAGGRRKGWPGMRHGKGQGWRQIPEEWRQGQADSDSAKGTQDSKQGCGKKGEEQGSRQGQGDAKQGGKRKWTGEGMATTRTRTTTKGARRPADGDKPQKAGEKSRQSPNRLKRRSRKASRRATAMATVTATEMGRRRRRRRDGDGEGDGDGDGDGDGMGTVTAMEMGGRRW